MAYERFGRDVNTVNDPKDLDNVEELNRKSLNIGFEWSVLVEAQHIIDELQMMQEIFTQQIAVMRDFETALRTMRVHPDTLARADSLITEMTMRREELSSLEKLQAKTRVQVCHWRKPRHHRTYVESQIVKGSAGHETATSWNHRNKGCHPTSGRGSSSRTFYYRVHGFHHFLREPARPYLEIHETHHL